MNRLIYYGKSIIAGFFLLLFSAILAEKTLHAHGNPPDEMIGKIITNTQSAGNCALCDLQLTADSDISPAPVVYLSISVDPETSEFIDVFIDQSLPQSRTDRGPPSL